MFLSCMSRAENQRWVWIYLLLLGLPPIIKFSSLFYCDCWNSLHKECSTLVGLWKVSEEANREHVCSGSPAMQFVQKKNRNSVESRNKATLPPINELARRSQRARPVGSEDSVFLKINKSSEKGNCPGEPCVCAEPREILWKKDIKAHRLVFEMLFEKKF